MEANASFPFVIGVDSFGDITKDAAGRPHDHPENLRTLVEEGVAAERAGLDFFGLGEHHIEEMPLSAPDLVLTAVAARTSRIRLGSAVTVLSSDDPVRVFQRYATLDALSHGRAEVILGRGSSKESFPLFGFDLADYERLFEERLELFAALRAERPVTWSGTTRAALPGLQVFPRTASGALPTWVGVGGSPASVVRAARYGFNLMLGAIGGNPARLARLTELFRRSTAEAGTARGRSACTRRDTSPRPTSRRARSTGRTTRASCWRPAASGASLPSPASTTSTNGPTARSMSARPGRSPAGSSGPCASSAPPGSTSSTGWARCRTRT